MPRKPIRAVAILVVLSSLTLAAGGVQARSVKGVIEEVSAESVTVKTEGGEKATFPLTAQTQNKRVTNGRFTDIADGAIVQVQGRLASGGDSMQVQIMRVNTWVKASAPQWTKADEVQGVLDKTAQPPVVRVKDKSIKLIGVEKRPVMFLDMVKSTEIEAGTKVLLNTVQDSGREVVRGLFFYPDRPAAPQGTSAEDAAAAEPQTVEGEPLRPPLQMPARIAGTGKRGSFSGDIVSISEDAELTAKDPDNGETGNFRIDRGSSFREVVDRKLADVPDNGIVEVLGEIDRSARSVKARQLRYMVWMKPTAPTRARTNEVLGRFQRKDGGLTMSVGGEEWTIEAGARLPVVFIDEVKPEYVPLDVHALVNYEETAGGDPVVRGVFFYPERGKKKRPPVSAAVSMPGPVESKRRVDLPAWRTLRRKLDDGEPVTVLYLGGSITEGAMTGPPAGVNRDGRPYDYRGRNPDRDGWRALTFAWLQEHYQRRSAQMRMVNAAIGATHSELAAYRFEDHVAPYRPDLMFIEFAINDHAAGIHHPDPDENGSIARTMASIVGRARSLNRDMALFITVSTARDHDPLNSPREAARAAHLDFANRFRIPHLDVHRAFFADTLPDGATPENVFDGPDNPGSAVHPSPWGHKAYAAAVERVLASLLEQHEFAFAGEARTELPTPWPPEPVWLAVEELPHAEGWSRRPSIEYGGRPGHVLAGTDALYCDEPLTPLTIRFRGSAVLMLAQYHFGGDHAAGRLHVEVDGQSAVFVAGERPAAGEESYARLLPVAEALDPDTPHTLTLIGEADGAGELRLALHGIGIAEYAAPEPSDSTKEADR